MTSVFDQHPADRLADIRAQIKLLRSEEEEIRGHMIETGANLNGEEFIVTITIRDHESIDRALLERRFGKEVVKACCRITQHTVLTLHRHGENRTRRPRRNGIHRYDHV